MRLISAALLLTLLVSSLSPVLGVLEAYNTNLKCSCVQETSNFIHPAQIAQLQIVLPGHGCPKKEIIIRLKNKSTTVCVNPQTKWVQKVIRYFRKNNMRSTPPAPVKKT